LLNLKKIFLKKSDFNKTGLNIYTKINRYINEFFEANLIVDMGNKQKHIFGANTKLVVLKNTGAVFVDGLNQNF